MSSGLSSSTARDAPSAVENAAGTPQAPGQKSVTISLRVVLDLSANVQLFAYPADAATNPIHCAATMPAADISGLFAFFEIGPSGEGISGELGSNAAASGAGSAAAVADDFAAAAGTASAAEDNLNASAAVPFSAYPGYTSYSSLGDVALAWAAHTMFSHPDATAPIDNDRAVISTINAALAPKLTAAILALPQAELTALVNSVVGQDSSRGGKGVDNNDPAHPQPLAMFAGDVIIVRIQLNDFTAANANSSQQVPVGDYGLAGAARQFDVVLTLA
jgi:hypothetical protein